MKRNAPIIDRNGLALDAAVAAAPGAVPLHRNRHITRQTGYMFGFQIDPRAWEGLSGWDFRKALSAELSWNFGSTYTPLHHSELYYPQTKKRHAISKAHLRAITPSRWDLPVADALYNDRAIMCGWSIYGLAPGRAHLLTDAIAKLHENRGELVSWAAAAAAKKA